MNDVPKVLVVDDGERTPDGGLSAELAELGFASVTTSFEAAEDVLAVLPTPSAILLQLPGKSGDIRHQAFRNLSERLTAHKSLTGIPVVIVEPRQGIKDAFSSRQDMGSPFALTVLAKPDSV